MDIGCCMPHDVTMADSHVLGKVGTSRGAGGVFVCHVNTGVQVT